MPEDEFDGRPELVKKRARSILAERIWRTFQGATVAIALGALLLNAWQGSQTRQKLVDCTTPSGECYKENSRRTVVFLKQLIDDNTQTRHIVVLTAACDDRPDVVSETDPVKHLDLLTQCVEEGLAKEAK